MVTSPRPAYIAAEDNSADVMLVRMALRSFGLNCVPSNLAQHMLIGINVRDLLSADHACPASAAIRGSET